LNPSPSNGDWAVAGVTHGGPSNECSQGTYTNVAYGGAGSAANDVAAFLAPYETPFDYTAPSVSGAPIVGNQLSCDPGTWAEPAASFTYTWETVGDATPIADVQTYTPQSSDVGHQLECSVTATVPGFGSTNSATSGPAVAVAPFGISTSQQPASVTVGGSVADQATVSGGDSPTGTVTFNLYNNPNGTGTPLFTDTETLSGGTATSASYTTTAAGTDYWVVTYNGDANNSIVSSGTAAEPVTISPATPSISTSQQPASVTLGGSVADQATVSGGDDPTGTVTFNLYNNPNGTGTPLFTDANVALSGGVATSTGYTPTAAGTDYWVVTYNGDVNNNSVSSGDAAEPVTVSQAPQTIKFISNPPANPVVGGSYTVTATGGASGNPVTLTIDSVMTTAGACSLPANATSGAKVSLTGTGTCTIDFNQAGSTNYLAAAQLQQSFTIDQAPMFVLDTPPLTATVGQAYDYVFTASGVPTPAFALAVGAPSWLSVNATTGEVTGTPPKGTTSFTYTLTATNTVSVATAGPFTVKVVAASVKADISAVLSCPASLKTGTTGSCTLTVANTGPAAASAVVAAVELPAGLSEVSCSTGCVAHRNVFTWSLASLAAPASTKFTLTVKAVHAGSNLVLGAAASQSPDPNPFNNVSVQTITVTKS
jgi:hypothetical protein